MTPALLKLMRAIMSGRGMVTAREVVLVRAVRRAMRQHRRT